MTVYAVEKENFVKIGVSANIKSRIASYGNVKQSRCFEIEGQYLVEKARFIETGLQEKFNSETEYLYGANFDEVVEYIQFLLSKLPNKAFTFMPLMIELVYNEDGYIDLQGVTDHINSHRIKLNKPLAKIDKYMGAISTKQFLSSLENTLKVKPVFSKRGKYGGTFVLPYVVLDYLAWADVELKIKVYEYMYSNLDYINFINLCGKEANVEINEAFKIAVCEVNNG